MGNTNFTNRHDGYSLFGINLWISQVYMFSEPNWRRVIQNDPSNLYSTVSKSVTDIFVFHHNYFAKWANDKKFYTAQFGLLSQKGYNSLNEIEQAFIDLEMPKEIRE